MDSKTYWSKREADQLAKNITDESEYAKAISDIYNTMLDNIQKEIESFYARYATKEGISIAQAKKKVSQLDMDAYERKAKKYVKEKDFSDLANEEMRLYNLTMKVNRLELLKANIGLEMVTGFDGLQKYFDSILTNRTLAEFSRQAGILGKSVLNNAKAANAIVNASFNNARFSDRIWMYQDLLKHDLEKLLKTGLIQGKHPRELSRQLVQRFGASNYNALRLMRTEMARVQTEAQKQSFDRNGYDKYEFIAENGPRTCDICLGMNGKVYEVKKMMPGNNAPPIHANCVLPDTKIIAPDVEAMTRSLYSGDVIEIRTANGRSLTVTPNHIMLTARGWVSAKGLVKGDKVINYLGWDEITSPSPGENPANDYSVPTVKQLYTAVVKSGLVTAVTVPASTEHFKGDVVEESEIDIVFVDGLLRSKLDSPVSKFLCNSLLIGAGERSEGILSTERTLAQLLICIGLASDCIVSGFDIARVFLGGSLTSHELICLRTASDYDARLKKAASNHRTADAKFFSKRVLAAPLEVKGNNPVNVKIEPCAMKWNTQSIEQSFDGALVDTKVGGNNGNALAGLVPRNNHIDVKACSQTMSGNVIAIEDIRDGSAADCINISEIVDGLSAFIEFDDVEFISTRYYSGHVYDASSLSTLYLCNGIVSSNCRCSTAAHMDREEFDKWLENQADDDIIKLPRYKEAVLPKAKFTEYALNPNKDPDKAKAFESALGYNVSNYQDLVNDIKKNLPRFKATPKGDNGWGMTYEVIMELTGPNGKVAKVLTAWIDDERSGEMRLTTTYVDK